MHQFVSWRRALPNAASCYCSLVLCSCLWWLLVPCYFCSPCARRGGARVWRRLAHVSVNWVVQTPVPGARAGQRRRQHAAGRHCTYFSGAQGTTSISTGPVAAVYHPWAPVPQVGGRQRPWPFLILACPILRRFRGFEPRDTTFRQVVPLWLCSMAAGGQQATRALGEPFVCHSSA